MKVCNHCKENLPNDMFHFRSRNDKINLYPSCKPCRKLRDAIRVGQPHTYLKGLYRAVRNRYNKCKRDNFKGTWKGEATAAKQCRVTWEEFLDRFMDQYAALGLRCPLTNIKMTTVQGQGYNPTSLTVDRIDNDVMYTKENIMFISQKANTNKKATTLYSIAALDFYLNNIMGSKYRAYKTMVRQDLKRAACGREERKENFKNFFGKTKTWDDLLESEETRKKELKELNDHEDLQFMIKLKRQHDET